MTDDLIDSIISANIPVFTEEEKYNETVTSSVNRIEAVIRGQAVRLWVGGWGGLRGVFCGGCLGVFVGVYVGISTW